MAKPGRPKKDIVNATAATANLLDVMATGSADTPEQAKKKKLNNSYKFNLHMPAEYHAYLQAASYYSSKPGNNVSITEYVCNLIAADMEKHPEWKDGNKNEL